MNAKPIIRRREQDVPFIPPLNLLLLSRRTFQSLSLSFSRSSRSTEQQVVQEVRGVSSLSLPLLISHSSARRLSSRLARQQQQQQRSYLFCGSTAAAAAATACNSSITALVVCFAMKCREESGCVCMFACRVDLLLTPESLSLGRECASACARQHQRQREKKKKKKKQKK